MHIPFLRKKGELLPAGINKKYQHPASQKRVTVNSKITYLLECCFLSITVATNTFSIWPEALRRVILPCTNRDRSHSQAMQGWDSAHWCLHFNLTRVCVQPVSLLRWWAVSLPSPMCCHDDTVHRLLQPCRGLCANPFPDSPTMCVKVQPPLPLLLHCLPARHLMALLCLRNLDLKCTPLKCSCLKCETRSISLNWIPSGSLPRVTTSTTFTLFFLWMCFSRDATKAQFILFRKKTLWVAGDSRCGY